MEAALAETTAGGSRANGRFDDATADLAVRMADHAVAGALGQKSVEEAAKLLE